MEELKEQINEVEEVLQEDINEEQVEELEKKVDEIEEEQKSLQREMETRAATLEKAKNAESTEIFEEREEIKMEVNYRSAYFKKLMGKELNEEERALTSATTAVIPTETSDRIFEKMVKLVPLLDEIELFHVKGNLKFAVETTRANAGYHAENSTGINVDSTAVLTEVSLGSYEFTKLIQVSSNMLDLSIDAFENWLTDMLAGSIAEKIEDEIINGSGSGAVKGIDALSFADGTNGVQYNGSTGLTGDEVREAIGYLPAGYDRGAKILMSKKTLFNQFLGLQDNAKNDLVRNEGNAYFVYGYPVIISDKVADGDAFIGNFKKYVGNLNADIEVKKAFDIDTNSYKYLGVAEFDGKPACTDAFVKISTSL